MLRRAGHGWCHATGGDARRAIGSKLSAIIIFLVWQVSWDFHPLSAPAMLRYPNMEARARCTVIDRDTLIVDDARRLADWLPVECCAEKRPGDTHGTSRDVRALRTARTPRVQRFRAVTRVLTSRRVRMHRVSATRAARHRHARHSSVATRRRLLCAHAHASSTALGLQPAPRCTAAAAAHIPSRSSLEQPRRSRQRPVLY